MPGSDATPGIEAGQGAQGDSGPDSAASPIDTGLAASDSAQDTGAMGDARPGADAGGADGGDSGSDSQPPDGTPGGDAAVEDPWRGLLVHYALHRVEEENAGVDPKDIVVPNRAGELLNLKLSPVKPNEISYGPTGATFTGNGGRLEATDLASSNFGQAIQEAGALTVEVWAKTPNGAQSDPKRMVAYSHDHTRHSLILGQEEENFAARCQTTATSDIGGHLDGEGCLGFGDHLLMKASVFPTTEFRHLALVFDPTWPGTAIYVDGVEQGRCFHMVGSGGYGVLRGWTEDNQIFALGDSPAGSRSWEGTLKRVLVWNRTLSPAELRDHSDNEAALDSP